MDQIQQTTAAPNVTNKNPTAQPPTALKIAKKIEINPKSFAEVLAESKAPIEAVKSIVIDGNDQQTDETIDKLKKDERMTDILITSNKDTGDGSFTIRCADADSMTGFVQIINEHCPNIKVIEIIPKRPQIKIKGIPATFVCDAQILTTELELKVTIGLKA